MRIHHLLKSPKGLKFQFFCALCIAILLGVSAWAPDSCLSGLRRQNRQLSPCRKSGSSFRPLSVVPGADIEQPPVEQQQKTRSLSADIPTSTSGSSSLRGKVNEIDFCIAPADVSLSRAYGTTVIGSTASSNTATADTDSAAVGLSLTRALNNASNRAVRRILLARSWPSAEALNLSLRQVAAIEAAKEKAEGGAKCPVPRPILNVLTRQQKQQQSSTEDDAENEQKRAQPKPRSRTDEEYVADQIKSFQERYGSLTGYGYAQDYLECVLSLATSGVESEKAADVLSAGIYDEAYRRVLSVLRTVGVEFETVNNKNGKPQRRIAAKLKDQDICLSMLDKIQMRQAGVKEEKQEEHVNDEKESESELSSEEASDTTSASNTNSKKKKGLKFWKRKDELTGEDLGGVLLSAKEPTMTRQLNILSNIVQRALLFGGDEELLVLAETLDADRSAFIERWYPGTKITGSNDEKDGTRPGVRYLDCLIQLLRNCHADGVVRDLNPPFPLPASYANAYERLVASSVELGSGYLKPAIGAGATGSESSVELVKSMPKPRTAQEELGRFAVWETNFRSSTTKPSAQYSPYPMDLVGSWEVRDEIGGETIGTSKVILKEEGDVEVAPPLEGLRWRLDPGPTHLDTCTFQVLSTLDGTILQYRGFIDRGARLEARFSKRLISIRGSVMFQMRDGGSVDYYKDMLPINYRTGTTKFVMTKTE